MRYFLEFSYYGEPYCGWQNQPNALSVQEELEKALSIMLRTPISITGAGRTDAGVHAKQMFAHFDFEGDMNSHLVYKLNSFLPEAIAVKALHPVADSAHARFDAVKRTYEYWVVKQKNPFLTKFAYKVPVALDVEQMNRAAAILFEYEDFKCFSKSNTDVKTYICRLMKAEWQETDQMLVFTISADRFLRNMVRAVVGTLIEVGSGKLRPEQIRDIVESGNRGRAGFSVPAHGLYLTQVVYPYINAL